MTACMPKSRAGGSRRKAGAGAFTLLEIMLVVGILAIVLGMGVPAFVRALHRGPMGTALTELKDACDNARAQAILQGRTVNLVFHPLDHTFGVDGAAAAGPQVRAGLSGTIPDSITVEMLDINLTEFKDADLARVRFFANGTCDELTIVLHSDQNGWRKLTLESTTGLVSVGDVKD